MKRILLILVLVFSAVWGEDSKDSRWRGFFGIEAGVGMIRLFHQPIPLPMWLNLSVLKETPYSWSGNVALVGGWQKYTEEKRGIRNTLGFGFMYFPKDFGIFEGSFPYKHADFSNGFGFNIFYIFDGLIDFVKNDSNSFGMIAGTKVGITLLSVKDFLKSNPSKQEKVVLGSGSVDLRLGLKTQIENNVLELTLEFPIVGISVFFDPTVFNHTLTLGYKYFF